MLTWIRRLALVAVVAVFAAATTAAASGKTTHKRSVAGTWSGYISGSGFKRRHIVITVNARETAGTWRINATCYGPEHLDSISYGYHHFLRELGQGAQCGLAGNIDCVKRVGANLYDAVTMSSTSVWDVHGTLHRVSVHHA